MRTCVSIVFGTVLSLVLVLTLVGPSLSDQGEISGGEIVPSLSGIWSIEGLEEGGRVVIALEQNGSELYGRAKYELDSGEGWNGQVIGSVAGEEIELVIASGQGEAPISRSLRGRYNSGNQSLAGEFLQISDGRIIRRGSFMAIIINPHVRSYSPAAIKEIVLCAGGGLPEEEEAESVPLAANGTTPKDLSNSKFYDVHLDAENVMTGMCGIGRGLN